MTPEEVEALKRELLEAAASVKTALIYAVAGVIAFMVLSSYSKRNR